MTKSGPKLRAIGISRHNPYARANQSSVSHIPDLPFYDTVAEMNLQRAKGTMVDNESCEDEDSELEAVTRRSWTREQKLGAIQYV